MESVYGRRSRLKWIQRFLKNLNICSGKSGNFISSGQWEPWLVYFLVIKLCSNWQDFSWHRQCCTIPVWQLSFLLTNFLAISAERTVCCWVDGCYTGTNDVDVIVSHIKWYCLSDKAYQQWCVCVCVPHRWKRDDRQEKVKDPVTCLPVLQFIAIQRRDVKEWAIPGVSML